MLRLAETVGVSEPVFAPVLAAHGRLGAPPGGAGPRWLCSAEFGRPGPLEASGCSEAAPSSTSAPLQLIPPLSPPPNWRNPDRLREVGGASRGTAPPRRCASGILARCGRGAAGQFGANHLPPAKWKTSPAAIFLFFQFCQWSQRPNLQTPVVTYWKVVGTLIFLG